MKPHRNSRWCVSCVVGLMLSPTIASAIPPNVPVSGHLPGLQNEEQVWICPLDTSVVIANHRDFRLGYRQIGLARSTDGGQSWTDTLIAPNYQLFDRQSDPVMTVTSSGRIVAGHLDFATSSATLDSSHLAFLLSDDCGETWSGFSTVRPDIGDYFEDKQFVTSDRSGGVYDGSVYVSWTRFSPGDPTRIIFSGSPDGAETWNDTIIVGPALVTSCFGTISAGQFSQPLVGKDGAVYVFWQGYDIDSSSGCSFYNAIRVNKSLDGGQTWSGDRVIQRVDGWNSTASSGIDIYSQPTTDADLSSGPHAGNLYLQYRDTTPPLHDSDIMFRRSLDTGQTWSVQSRVNDDPSGLFVEQFHNWMVCNEEGILASIWYDQRTDPSHYLFDVFAGYSFDGGATWTSNERISDVSIDPGLLAFASGASEVPRRNVPSHSPNTPMAGLLAEYIGLTCAHDKVVAVWTDTRDGDQDVRSAAWYLHPMIPRPLVTAGDTLGCGDSLKWATSWKEADDLYRVQLSSDPSFGAGSLLFTGMTTEPSLALQNGLPTQQIWWRVKTFKAPGGVPADSSEYGGSSIYNGCASCACDCHADPACDEFTTILDVVEAVNAAFRNDPAAPDPNTSCPRETTDTDCNGFTDIIDVSHIVNVAFRNGNPVTEFCDPCL